MNGSPLTARPRLEESREGPADHDPSGSSPALRGGEDRRPHLAERVVAEVVLEPSVPGHCLARVDLERNTAGILRAVDACEQNHGLHPRVAETMRGNNGWKHPDVSPSARWPAKLATPSLPTMCPAANWPETTPPEPLRMIHQIVTGSPAGSPLVRNVIEMPSSVLTSDAVPWTSGVGAGMWTSGVGAGMWSFHPVTSTVCLVSESACAANGSTSARTAYACTGASATGALAA
jgi:hypothetical protein